LIRRPVAAALAVAAALVLPACSGSDDKDQGAPPAPSTSASPPASPTPSAGPSTPSPSAPAPSTAASSPAPASPPAPSPPADGSLRRGASGPEVEALQRRLQDLGYWIGTVDGHYGGQTQQAVYALQKASGVGRDGVVGAGTRAALDRAVRPQARSHSGHVVEIDLNRQLLMLVDGGRVDQVLNTSTGSNGHYLQDGVRQHAVTPRGNYKIFRQVDGWDPGPLGALYKPKYFNGGIAIHGFGSVPPYPASHGCARVSLEAISWMWRAGKLPTGTPVWVY
jgi:N-acetylmuramoyl-L-alanine amidase